MATPWPINVRAMWLFRQIVINYHEDKTPFDQSPCKDAGVNSPTAYRTSTIEELLRQVRFLRGLPDEIIAALAEVCVRHQYREGATIFLEGEPGNGMYVVEAGIVKICRLSLEGREHIMHMVRRGESFNDVAALDGGPHAASAIAWSNVVVWIVPRDRLQALAHDHPELAWAFIEDLAGRARYLVGLVEDLAMRSVRGRLANLLLEQARAGQSEYVPRMLTQEEMAARLGTVREMVGRTLRSMAAAGILEFDRHRIVILDPERLAEEAEV
jgi:CRP-like cAMP-binding protein